MSDGTTADERRRDENRDDANDSFFSGRGFSPGYSGRWLGGVGWRPFWSGGADEEYDETNAGETAYEDRAYDETAYDATYGDREVAAEDNGWWDEGLITLLLVVGVVLFVFPEPATSALGVLLIVAGLIAWLVDWMG